MVERYIDKKIRFLQEILDAPARERLDSKGRAHHCKDFSTEGNCTYEFATGVSHELKLTVSSESNLGEIFGDSSNDYLLEIIVEDEDVKRLSKLLKEYQGQFPKRKNPLIREKTLELISRRIGNLNTGYELIKFLKECGVDEELIVYPNTKWRMVFDVLWYLSNSGKEEDKFALSKIIGEATHPLMLDGNKSTADTLRGEFDNYLQYDNFGIAYDKDSGTYLALRNMDNDEANVEAQVEAQIEGDEMVKYYEEQSEKQLKFLCEPNNKEKISLLRKAYQQLMNVVFFFCEDSTYPAVELNQNFRYLYKLINTTINELGLSQVDTSPFSRNKHFFYLPFSNLFSAEKDYEEQGKKLNWQQMRPEINAMYGDIEELYQEVNGSDVLAEPDKQKKLNEIQFHLSTLKKKREMAKKIQTKARQMPVINTKIEITKLPELQIKGFEKKVVLSKPKGNTILIPIKDVRLDEKNYLLEINSGEKIISFKSKKKGEGLEKETKQFKILYHLWDFRWELKDGRVLKKGDYISLDNLVKGSGSESTEAAYKHIQRLTNRFKNEGVAIEIKGENEKYRLIINKA